MSEEGKVSADSWFSVELLDLTDGYSPETGKAVGDLTVEYKELGAGAGWTSYSPAAGNWQEHGDGVYGMQMGAGEFSSAGRWQVQIQCAGCRTFRFTVEARKYLIQDLFDANTVDLLLNSVNITSSSGTALTVKGGGASGHGIRAEGNGAGAGLVNIGGATGPGFYALGKGGNHGAQFEGQGDGFGLYAKGGTTGDGIRAEGRGDACGIHVIGGGNGIQSIAGGGSASFNHGLFLQGNGTGEGLHAIGGTTSGAGIRAACPAGNGFGIYAEGAGSGAAFEARGGSTSGAGIHAEGFGSGTGIHAEGGPTGNGILAEGSGTKHGIYALSGSGASAHGIYCKSQSSSGDGINAEGSGTLGHGIFLQGDGGGEAIHGIAGATGAGARFEAGASSNDPGILGQGNGDGAGIMGSGGSAGHGIHADGTGIGHGFYAESGGGATGDGIKAESKASNGNGIAATANGNGSGLRADSPDSGHGIYGSGGASIGHGMFLRATGDSSGNGLYIERDQLGLGGTSAAMRAAVTGGTGNAIEAEGDGTGHGLSLLSGDGVTGNGLNAAAQSTNGHGIAGSGVGAGHGLYAKNIDESGTGHGIYAKGGGTSGDGFRSEASTQGHGINAIAAGDPTDGFRATGSGAGHGLSLLSGDGATGNGLNVVSQSGGGHGIYAVGGDIGGNGIYAYGGPSSGSGFRAEAQTLGAGANFIGAGATEVGLYVVGGPSGAGIYAAGGSGANGHGIYATGGTLGHGIYTKGGTTSGDGLRAEADTSGAGMKLIAGAGGKDLDASTIASVSGEADAGSDASNLVDSARTEIDDYWIGQWLVMKTGSNAGLARLISDFVASTDTITVNEAFPAVIASGDDYEIKPAGDVEASVIGGVNVTQWAGNAVTGDGDWLDMMTDINSLLTGHVALSAEHTVLSGQGISIIADTEDIQDRIGTGVDLGDGAEIAEMLTALAGKTASAGSYDRTTDSNEANQDTAQDIKAKTDSLPPTIKKNTAIAKFKFVMLDALTHDPLPGLNVTAARSLDDSNFTTMVNSVSERGSGLYEIDIAQADTNCDSGAWKFTASGAEATILTFLTEA